MAIFAATSNYVEMITCNVAMLWNVHALIIVCVLCSWQHASIQPCIPAFDEFLS